MKGLITLSQLEESKRRRAAEAAATAAVSEYRATRTARVTTHKPTPEMYGLWDGFDFNAYDLEEKTFRRRRSIGVAIIVLILGAIVTVLGSEAFGNSRMSGAIIVAWCYVLFGVPILGLLYNRANMDRFLKECFCNYLIYSDNVSAYRASLSAWEFTNTERGLGYWQALRGTEFEAAVALLLRRRGCDVMATKGSGDGGVDLVLNIGGNALWCQCKGHAKPVSVAPVREIAGVCSRGQAKPVVIAVNGYTRPAIEAAHELGVTCLDAPDLCKLARLEAIASVGEFVHGFARQPIHGRSL